jgi:hypothetical protein
VKDAHKLTAEAKNQVREQACIDGSSGTLAAIRQTAGRIIIITVTLFIQKRKRRKYESI